MAFHHRKLLNDSIIDALCERSRYCNIFLNPDGWCPSTCWDVCSGVCKQLIPPPPPPPCPPPPFVYAPSDADRKVKGLSVPLTVCLAVLATAFFIFTCYTIYKFYTVWSSTRRRRPQPEEDNNDNSNSFEEEDYGPVVDHPIWYIRTIGLQPSVINAITIVNYKRADGLVEGGDCAVCLSEFEEDETLRLLPKCNHAFHIPCIDTWLQSHTNCPMCRAGIVSNAAVPVATQEATDHDSNQVEEVDVSEDSEQAQSERVIEINESNINEGDECKVDLGVRRSVSLDSLSAAMISAAVSNALGKNSDSELVKEKDVVRNDNQGLLRLSWTGSSSSIKRSASCSAKVFLSRHSSSSSNRNRS